MAKLAAVNIDTGFAWEYAPAPDDLVISLDPGMAFGTGTHSTTRLCLMSLEDLMQPGYRVLDLGCGSGILAIGAAKLGAVHVLAVDIDPVAVQITAENAALNGVGDVIVSQLGSLDTVRGSLPAGIEAEALVGAGSDIEDAVSRIDWLPGEVALVGSSRLAQPRRLFLGSTAGRILRALPVPMIVVPRTSEASS